MPGHRRAVDDGAKVVVALCLVGIDKRELSYLAVALPDLVCEILQIIDNPGWRGTRFNQVRVFKWDTKFPPQ